MKDAHGIEPTRFMKRKESDKAIICVPNSGPVFGCIDIGIRDNCTEKNSCIINYNGTRGYDCHPLYKSSLFVNTDKADKTNYCSLMDYEVYTHN